MKWSRKRNTADLMVYSCGPYRVKQCYRHIPERAFGRLTGGTRDQMYWLATFWDGADELTIGGPEGFGTLREAKEAVAHDVNARP